MSQDFVLDRRNRLRFGVFGLGVLMTMAGCAKFPAITETDATRVIFRMTVKGEIRSDYVYIFPIRTSTDINPIGDGPNPVVSVGSANGFVTGNANYFVLWTPDTQQYTLYRFDDTNLIQFTPIGIPLNPVDITPGTGARTIGFEVSLDQLVATPTDWTNLQSLQINFLTMNYRLTPGASPSGRVIDALGDTSSQAHLNEPAKILLATSNIYQNATASTPEPENDCVDPDLDISDWSVEVRRQL